MTSTEMRGILLDRFNDPGQALYTNTVLQRLLNQALRQISNVLIASKIYINKKSIDVTFISGSQEIVLTSTSLDLWPLERILYVLDEDKINIPVYEEEFSKLSDTPSCYLKRHINDTPLIGGQTTDYRLGWYREPTETFILTVYYLAQIPAFQTVGIIQEVINDIPSQIHDVIVDCATYLGWANKGLRQELLPTIQFWKQQYEEGLQIAIMALGPQAETQQSVVDVYASD